MQTFKSLIFLVLVFFSLSALAQETGTIRVTVYDDETGEPLIGANVVIEGTTTGNVTDLDGKASIINLTPGKYPIQITYVSYQSKVIENVEVKAGEVNTLSVRLATESIGLDEVVVTAEAVRSSENALLTVQKKSAKVLDAISSDQFSRNGDNDAAAAVKRVTGVTVESGKYVYVRGLGDRYSKAILNGADIPGLDPNRNSVQMDLFPSNLIDNIIVYKSFTPDLTGEFAGGLVNVETKDFPDRFTFQFSGSLGYNDQSSLNSNFLTYKGSSTDWLGFDDGFRELPDILQRYETDNFPRPFISTDNAVTRASRSFENTQFDPTTTSPFLDHSLSLSVGNQKTVFGKQLGFVAGLTYRRGFDFYQNGAVNRFEGVTQGIPTLNNDVLFSVDDQNSSDEVNIGALVNVSLKLNNLNKVGFNVMHNQSGTSSARYQEGLRLDNAPDSTNYLQNRVLSYVQRSLSNAQVKGEHTIASLNNFKVEWQSSYTMSQMDEPDLRFLLNNIFLSGSKEAPDSIYRMNNRSRPGRYYRSLDETNFDNRLHLTLPATIFNGLEGKIKFGGAYTYKEREFREDRYEYFIDNITYDGDPSVFFQTQNLGFVNGELRNYLDLFTQEPNNYDADQSIYAGYLMLETPVFERLRMTGGVRFERTEMYLESFGDDPVIGELENNDILPALNFTYEMGENTNLRVAYGRTLARPSFREFAPLVTFAFYGEFDQLGNANLDRTIIDNFDIRWETYPRLGEYIGVSLFYKNFDNPIENTVNPRAGGSTREYQYANVDQGLVYGAEFEVRKNLDFITPALQNFKVSANVSYIYSQVDLEADELQSIREFNPEAKSTRDMFNQSPYVVNASAVYDNQEAGLSSNLTFNVFGARLKYFQTDLPFIYERPRPDMSFSMKKSLSENISMRLRVNNILNPEYKTSMNYLDQEFIYNSFQVGRSYSIGFTYLIE